MSISENTPANKTVYPKYAINVSAQGISVEAPTKKECLELFSKVQKSTTEMQPSKMLKEAIR